MEQTRSPARVGDDCTCLRELDSPALAGRNPWLDANELETGRRQSWLELLRAALGMTTHERNGDFNIREDRLSRQSLASGLKKRKIASSDLRNVRYMASISIAAGKSSRIRTRRLARFFVRYRSSRTDTGDHRRRRVCLAQAASIRTGAANQKALNCG